MSALQLNSTIPAMRILELEHRYLSHLMNEWHQIVLALQKGGYSTVQARGELERLRQLILAFKQPLEKHCKKEESYFFPLLGQYIGYDQGPIMSIEQEHEEVTSYIDHFLHHAVGEHSLEEIRSIVGDAAEAFEILTVHFVKEESVLFSMTAQVMSKLDQERLAQQLHTLIDE